MASILDKAIRDEPLARHTSLGIGGPARLYLEVTSEQELAEALDESSRAEVPVLILGGGSNVVVSDAGFDGLVVRLKIEGIDTERSSGGVVLHANAGVNWDDLVAYTVENDLQGFECLSGIPGDVGATPIQNVGAYGQEVGETLLTVRALDRDSGQFVELSKEECGLSYRDSRFKSRERDRFVITRVSFRLEPGAEPAVRYPDLERHLSEKGITNPSLLQVREAVLAVRAAKGMVIDPSDPDSRSAGSFFTNPILDQAAYEKVLGRVQQLGLSESFRSFPVENGRRKLSAAWLIDHSGFDKGYTSANGRTGLSTKHVLAIVNRGGATAADVRSLAAEIQAAVKETFGVEIVPEPNFVGDHSS